VHGVGWLRGIVLWRGTAGALLAGAAILADAGDPAFLIAARTPLAGYLQATGRDVVLDQDGNAYVSGIIASSAFPGVSSAQITNGGFGQRFVARVEALGAKPAFVTVVGAPVSAPFGAPGHARDAVAGLAGDRFGNTYLVAYEGSLTYPVTGGPYLATTGSKYVYRVSSAGVAARLSAALDPAMRSVGALALDASGSIYITGSATDGLVTSVGAPFPTASVAPGCVAPYVAKLDPGGQAVLYATYLGVAGVQGQPCGGVGPDGNYDASGFALALDVGGNVYVTGQAEPGFAATPGAVNAAPTQPIVHIGRGSPFQTASHAFVAKIGPTGSLVFSARIGGNDHDRGTSVAVDAGGFVYVAGKTASNAFPVAGGFGSAFPYAERYCLNATPEVGFVAKLVPDGSQLVYSGFVPAMGDAFDRCMGTFELAPVRIHADELGNVVVTGSTSVTMRNVRPTWNAMEPVPNGLSLVMVVAADGRTVAYASSFEGAGVEGSARDGFGNLVTIDYAAVVRTLSPHAVPVELAVAPEAACAGAPVELTARVAASYDRGSVTFEVDDNGAGAAMVADGRARLTTTLPAGVRRLRATYAGAGAFDGYSSTVRFVAVNQAGACP
jgi:hypothetical protein